MLKHVGAIAALALISSASAGEIWDYKKEMLPQLIDRVDEILKTQDKPTGRFGSGVFIVTDQNVIFPLAAAWAIDDPANPWHHKPELLDAIMAGGDALIAAQKEDGKFLFRKKDNSTWGDIYMPWTYSRWIRAYGLVRDGMPKDRREKWEKALTLAFEGIAKEETAKRLANIPCHNSMGLYLAGTLFDRPDWLAAAKAYMHKVVDYQNPCGFWSEHAGPVVMYNFVYLDAIGTYLAISQDEYVRPALVRAAKFHVAMTYPDGSAVETVDERNGYNPALVTPNVGFTFSPDGRGYMQKQFEIKRGKKGALAGADAAASYLLYGEQGETTPPPDRSAASALVTADHNAMTRRAGPWFTCMSAYHTTISDSRWIQDRQNMVSLFHDKAGLIVGGGNTKLQPLWSTFTVGDVGLLAHKTGDETPNFVPPPGLVHMPTDAGLDVDATVLQLQYQLIKCRVRVDLSDAKRAKIIYMTEGSPFDDKGEGTKYAKGPIAAHVTFLAHAGSEWSTESGKKGKLNEPLKLAPGEAGEWFAHRGWRVHVPPQATLLWPVFPHNQYAKYGKPEADSGRLVMILPFSRDLLRYEVIVEVP